MTLPSVPASYFVQVTPEVLAAGGRGLILQGVLLTEGTRIPLGTAPAFPSAAAVSAYFGPSSDEAAFAAQYFGSFVNSNQKPGSLIVTQYPVSPVSAWMRGGAPASIATLAAITAGELTITIDGIGHTTTTLNLSGLSTYSAIAAAVQSALSVGQTTTYDAVSGAFVVTSSTTGASSTITVATGTAAAALGLTTATGAVLSQGAVAAVPATFMTALTAVTTNWASFTTLWEPSTAGSLAFAAWTSAQNYRYAYVAWDTDITVVGTPSTFSGLGSQIEAAGYTGTHLIYAPNNGALAAAFVLSFAPSLDFTQTNGRTTLAYRSSAQGLLADIADATSLANAVTNGYNAYVTSATANQSFNFYWNGSVSGVYDWFDTYINQIWLNAQFQLDLMLLLTQVKSIPYNADGDSLLKASVQDTITAAGNFGVFRPGVRLSTLQIAEVNAAVGKDVSAPLQTAGWYLFSNAAGTDPTVRQNRGSPPFSFFYVDGESVQTINMQSVVLQ